MTSSKKIPAVDLDETLDRLIENAEVLNDIQNKQAFQAEKKALEAIQESLLDSLTTLKDEIETSETYSQKWESFQEIQQHRRSTQESRFRRRKMVRRSRKKQALA